MMSPVATLDLSTFPFPEILDLQVIQVVMDLGVIEDIGGSPEKHIYQP